MSGYVSKHAITSYDRFVDSVDELALMLNRGVSEAALQSHLTEYPYILSQQFAHCHHVFPKVRLGNQYEVDFFCLDIPSYGREWRAIELESCEKSVVTKSNRKTAGLEHALQQIRDWRAWLSDNISYAWVQLGMEEINPRVFGYVIIGRRINYTPSFNIIRSQVLRDEHIDIRSWDGIVDWARKRAQHLVALKIM